MAFKSFLSCLTRTKAKRRQDWARVVMHETCSRYVEDKGPKTLDVFEISGGSFWQKISFKSYQNSTYPDFDICSERLEKQFDLIIADQVFEHLSHPWRAVRNVYQMLKPGGVFLITTPFMIKLHPHPEDHTRWSETGLKNFLEEGGFDTDNIETDSWGNRACVRANLRRWAKLGYFGSLKNEWKFPVTVWAFATKSNTTEQPQVD